MKKTIVICCDGTWNSPGDVANGVYKTNVQKLFESVCNINTKGVQQIKYYTEGVGTSGSKLRRILDGATGWGLDGHILNAYKFLVWNFVPGDDIYLFGFSRGAYTARSVAGLIRNCGIIRNDDLNLINEAYAHYRDRNKHDWRPNGPKAIEFREKNSHETTIRMIGVWDTVGALGIPFSFFHLYNKKKYNFHDPTLSWIVDYAYHALAIDEKRASFRPTLWVQSASANERKVPQVMEQRWFSGVHSNVGGGYPTQELSDLALDWMIEKAENAGLDFERDYITANVHGDSNGTLYNSFVLPFSLVKPYKRVISLRGAYNEVVNQSAFDRWNQDDTYRPSNLKHLINKKDTI